MASVIWDYIREEQAVLQRIVASNQTEIVADELAGKIKTIYFVGHGSSFNAAVSTLPYYNKVSGVRAYAYTPENLFTAGSALLLEDKNSSLVVGISQTGTSAGAFNALHKAIEMGYKTLSLTAVGSSPIASLSDYSLNLMCGEEDSNAKTKGYSATLTVLLLFAISLGKKTGFLAMGEHCQFINEINGMIASIPKVMYQVIEFGKKNKFGEGMKDLYVVTSGVHLGSAQEGQLKVMETMCIPTMCNDIGEFSHGMHRSINPGSSILLIRCPDGKESRIEQVACYFANLKTSVWIIDCTGKPSGFPLCLSLPSFKRTQSLFLVVLALQILSVLAPEYNSLDPNRNSNDSFTIVDGTRIQ